MRYKKIAAFVTAAALLLSGCSGLSEKRNLTYTDTLYDTVISVQILDPAKEEVLKGCEKLCRKYDTMFSMTNEESDIYKINHAKGAAVEVSQLRDFPLEVDGKIYPVWGVSVGNPHCVVFRDAIDDLNLSAIGPRFEHHPLFPEGVNTEFVRVVSPTALRVRVWERGNGETMACGTGACAAVAAAVEKGLCQAGMDISVSLPGGVLTVNYTPERVLLTGGAEIVYQGSFLY